MIEVGRLAIKLAGRDAGRKCVIVEILDKNYVLIDGLTRRRKCNILHLEPLKDKIEIKKNASQEAVVAAFNNLGIEIKEKKPKERKERPKKIKRKKEVTGSAQKKTEKKGMGGKKAEAKEGKVATKKEN